MPLCPCAFWKLFKQRVRSQHPETASFFSTEELCFLEYILNCMNKSLNDTSEQEERRIQKFYDLCYEGSWQKTLVLIACFSLASFCFNKTFHDLEAKGDWEGNILILMVISIFFIQNDQKYFPRYNQIAFIHKSF